MAGNKTFTSDIDDVDDMLEMKCTIVNSGITRAIDILLILKI